jgi:hypothetical protein
MVSWHFKYAVTLHIDKAENKSIMSPSIARLGRGITLADSHDCVRQEGIYIQAPQ